MRQPAAEGRLSDHVAGQTVSAGVESGRHLELGPFFLLDQRALAGIGNEVKIDGLHSKVKAGRIIELELSKIPNPVTGEFEELQLRKPTGLTSLWADLGKSIKLKISAPGLSFDHSGQYGEYAEFDYPPEGLK